MLRQGICIVQEMKSILFLKRQDERNVVMNLIKCACSGLIYT